VYTRLAELSYAKNVVHNLIFFKDVLNLEILVLPLIFMLAPTMVGGERTTCASTASSLNLRRANARRPLTAPTAC
jgi:hypothetical protein